MDVRACKPGLTPLFLTVPPMFERLVGYRGSCRFVAFSWGACDELVYLDDMLASGTLDSAGWQIFTDHHFVRKHLAPFALGSSSSTARHWLLLDRKLRRFFVGERDAIEAFLEAGNGVEVAAQDMPETTMGLDEFIALAGNPALRLGDELSAEDMMRRLQDQKAVCVELREWLNRLG
jgi:hypothetical protein